VFVAAVELLIVDADMTKALSRKTQFNPDFKLCRIIV
jgi:hypothetical protein